MCATCASRRRGACCATGVSTTCASPTLPMPWASRTCHTSTASFAAAAAKPRPRRGGPSRAGMKKLDDTDLRILALLQEDDRLSLAVIGRQVGLAPSSVNDRIRRLVDSGAIQGFHGRIAAEAL